VAVLLAAALAAGAMAVVTLGGSTSPSAPARDAAPTAPTPGTGEPSPTPVRPPAVPADWTAYTEPTEGWTVFSPARYAVSDRGALTQLRDESTRYTLRVDDVAASGSALSALQAFSTVLTGQLAGYQQRRVEPVQFRGWDAAELEFTYSDAGADLRVVDRSFVVDGRRYSLWWQTNADRFEESRPEFERIAGAFLPAR
jgi:hypothetical protein